MKNSNKYFKTIETPKGDLTRIDVEKIFGGLRVEIIGREYYITPELQEVFTKTKGTLVQKLSGKGKILGTS